MVSAAAQPILRSDRPDRPALPSRFGRYVLVEHLATGGMADLYRALAPGAAGVSKSICIKRIRDQRLDQPKLVALFIDEARISMQLSHPNIVHTFDFGRVGDEYFLALELVEGVDLGALIDASVDAEERLTTEEIAAIGEALCRALSHVHSRVRADGAPLGLVHRDVTPGNVLVTREGDVKLADFGVARLRANAAEGLRGTLAYMAPEQANRGVVDARTDVFGLGLVLFECLRGHSAYTGERAELLSQAQRGVVDLARTGTEPPLEAALLDVIERATAHEPDLRYPTAADMAEDLGRIVAQARAGGAADPRASLARRVTSSARAPVPVFTSEVPLTVSDRRRSVSFALDGEAPDFAERLAGTEMSQAATDAGTQVEPLAGARARPRRLRPVVLATLAGLAIGTALAVLWPVDGADSEGRGPGPDSEDRGPRADSEDRDPRADSEGRGPRADSEDRDPRADSEGRGPRADSEDRGPRADSEGRGPSTDSEGRGPSTEPEGGGPGAGPEGRAPSTEPEGREPPDPAVARVRPGTLDLNAVPWADVSVDGVARGTTPVRGMSVAPGRHRVRLVNPPLGVDRTMVVTIRAGEAKVMVVNLRDSGTNVASPDGGTSP